MGLELPFVTFDVFTKERFRGNALAIVTIPKDFTPKPTQAQKQTIAREFNLSETVFVHEEDGPSRHFDIFLPHSEIPFAGHPTIGTAVSLLPLGVNTLIAKAGPLAITQPTPGFVQASIPHDTHLHAARLRDVPSFGPSDLSTVPEIRNAELNAPIFTIVNGMNFILAELDNLDILSKVVLSPCKFPLEKLLDAGSPAGLLSRYYYVKLQEEPGKVVIRTRMIEGTFEDPATGSAACCLASYLSLHDNKQEGTVRYEITQGVEMGRDSDIIVEVAIKDGKIDTVSLAGTATQVMRGYVSL